jgi:hypothetical protein
MELVELLNHERPVLLKRRAVRGRLEHLDLVIPVDARSSASSRSGVTRMGWPAQAKVRGAHEAVSTTGRSLLDEQASSAKPKMQTG